ncbi:MAG: hypothetical protein ABIX28_07545 [Vicinamibacterales bacterium]
MTPVVTKSVIAIAACGICALALQARAVAAQTAATPRLKACSLLSKAEVKKHLPWNSVVDSMPPEEKPIGGHDHER